MKGSIIVASAIFAFMVIVMIGINTLLLSSPFTDLEIGLVFCSLVVLILTKPTIEEYLSLDYTEKR